jgi:hypothetical protein
MVGRSASSATGPAQARTCPGKGSPLADPVSEIVIPDEVAAALRELRLLDADCERLVFRIRARNDRAILSATDSDLDELIGFVAAEANHEPSRRRRVDTAFGALSDVAYATDS